LPRFDRGGVEADSLCEWSSVEIQASLDFHATPLTS